MKFLKPLVSVIIPNYNHARFLDERIQSVLNQTYQNYEIIILDDCSPDNGASQAVIEKYRTNSHISHIEYNEINSGATFKQWRKGLELAEGELIWIAESDDSCDPRLLERLVAEFREDPNLVFAFVHSILIDDVGNKHEIIQPSRHRYSIRCSGKEFIHKFLFRYNIIYNASSALFRKVSALNISPEYTTFKASGDWLFWIELCETGNVSMIETPLNFFRKHISNVTEEYASNGLQQFENRKILSYLDEHHLINTISKRCVEILNFYHYKYDLYFTSEEIRGKILELWAIPWYYYPAVYLLKIIYFVRPLLEKLV